MNEKMSRFLGNKQKLSNENTPQQFIAVVFRGNINVVS